MNEITCCACCVLQMSANSFLAGYPWPSFIAAITYETNFLSLDSACVHVCNLLQMHLHTPALIRRRHEAMHAQVHWWNLRYAQQEHVPKLIIHA